MSLNFSLAVFVPNGTSGRLILTFPRLELGERSNKENIYVMENVHCVYWGMLRLALGRSDTKTRTNCHEFHGTTPDRPAAHNVLKFISLNFCSSDGVNFHYGKTYLVFIYTGVLTSP